MPKTQDPFRDYLVRQIHFYEDKGKGNLDEMNARDLASHAIDLAIVKRLRVVLAYYDRANPDA